MRNKQTLLFLILIIIAFCPRALLHSQDDLLSAKNMLESLSEKFKTNVKDFKADVKWTQGSEVQKGKLTFKNPQKLRIDFTEPANQAICTNGYELWVYIPYLSITLHQNILNKTKLKNEEGSVETVDSPILINPVGFDKFLTEYSIQFHETKERVTYKDNTKVYQFKLLKWRTSKSGFNSIILYVQENGFIRQVKGTNAAYRQTVLEIDKIEANTNISDLVFDYEPPAHSSTVEDFITNEF